MAPPKRQRPCSIEGCKNNHAAHGYCATHLKRFRKYGDPLKVKQRQIHGASLQERFESYVGERGSGCWEWAGSRDINGYGRLSVDGIPALAHRISWSLYRGEITSEQHVLHRCDNPSCIRPEHLFLGDQIANMADKMAKKRHRYGVSRGTDHGSARLTEDQVREIRASTEASEKIAPLYGVSGRQIRDIRTRKSWRHLP